MRTRVIVIAAVVLLAAGAGWFWLGRGSESASNGPADRPSGAPGGSGGAGSSTRVPMTVELASPSRAPMTDRILVVGNLIGAATVEVVAKTSGRLQAIDVRIGDPVTKGRRIAQVEDREIQEQVKQAEASYEVARATVRQREADLKLAEVSAERSRNLFSRQLLSKEALDNADARYFAAVAGLDLSRAQFEQAKARLEELQINLAYMTVVSPVDGFVGRRNVDPGAYVSTNTPIVSVVDIHMVRLVANLVEKDLRRVTLGMPADVEVDAYPGDTFSGRVARLAPVLDPASRTAQMEVEVPNPAFRLKPGMYARVRFTVAKHENALVVPRNALVDVEGKRGVFVAAAGGGRQGGGGRAGAGNPGSGLLASFREVEVGLQDLELVEIVSGLSETERVVTTGAGALRDGDVLLLSGAQSEAGQKPQGGPGSRPPGQDARPETPPTNGR